MIRRHDEGLGSPTEDLKSRSAFVLKSMTRLEPQSRNPIDPLTDQGITWVFYWWRSEVPGRELDQVARSARAGFLRAAVTFGFPDRETHEYRSAITVHLWELGDAYTRGFRPPDGDWTRVMLHFFIHEPLHHAIGRCLAETFEFGDQEWVISRLGDARWW